LILRTDLRSKTEPEFEVRAEIADQADWTNLARVLRWAFAIELLVALVVQWHDYFLFDEYAFLDQGSQLAAQHLVSSGLRPGIDFGYTYGLLPLLAGKLLFGALGNSPGTYALTVSLIECFTALGIARIAAALHGRGFEWAFAILTLPFLMARYDNLPYALEAAFLTNAFAEQLHGRSGPAMALALCAALCKPAMGYLYGAVLLLMLFGEVARGRMRWTELARTLRPALVTGVAMVLVLSAVFGPRSLLGTILPIQGIANYRAMHSLGFHSEQLSFLKPSGVNWHYYFGTYTALWIVCEVWLLMAGIIVLVQYVRGYEIFYGSFVLTISVLAVADLLLFSEHYRYLTLIGAIGCIAIQNRWHKTLAVCVCVIAIPAFLNRFKSELLFRETVTSNAATGWLWAAPDLNVEWERAMSIAAGRKTAVLGEMGGAGLVVPGIESPVGAFFLAGAALPDDVSREYRQLAAAPVLILFYRYPQESGTVLENYPALKAAVQDDDVVFHGKYLEVRERRER
jgi:hypothetical protein